jgi:uncharacterized repeat protein (TIGR01451 family)
MHSPLNIIPTANIKPYVDINKTFAYRGDTVKYTISCKNYGSVDAVNVIINDTLPLVFKYISSSSAGIFNVTRRSLQWNLGLISGLKNRDYAAGKGTIQLIVVVNSDSGSYCNNVYASCSNGYGGVSNKYPNNISDTIQHNCVEGVRPGLLLKKSVSRDFVNRSDSRVYVIHFENSTNTGWLNGGCPGVRVTLGHRESFAPSLHPFFHLLHGGNEAYINYGNCRDSYYVIEPAVTGISKRVKNNTILKIFKFNTILS